MKHGRSQGNSNSRAVFAICALVLLTGLASFVATRHKRPGSTAQEPSRPIAKSAVLANYGKLPLVFEKNLGQADPSVRFLARANGYTLFLTDRQAVLELSASATPQTSKNKRTSGNPQLVRVALSGSNSPAQVEGLELQPGHSNYLIGNNPSRWQRHVALYGRVRYHDVYPGIDAVYYGNQNRLETDYIIAPGANPGRLALQVKGGRKLTLTEHGDLAIATAAGDLVMHRPDVYQEIDGTRREIAANYVLRNPRLVGIQLASYDSTKPLVVDPVIVYSTYLGGATGTRGGSADNTAAGIAVDGNGNTYITGSTGASNFPVTSGAFQSQNKSSGALNTNAFVTKLNPTGTALVYSTYLGGSNSDSATGIAIDASGDAYITGSTTSSDFPVSLSPIQSTVPTGNGGTTGFFAELDPGGANLLYGTYLGGNGTEDLPNGITVDANGNVYIVGGTNSTDFPVTFNALQATNNSASFSGASFNAFLSRINPAQPGLAGLVYSTYLGGATNDSATAVAVDANANAYITGYAESSNFPTTSTAFQQFLLGSSSDAFVARIDTVNSVLVYSSFLGGGAAGFDQGNCIAVDSSFNAYIGGHTYSTNFPVTTGAFETTYPGTPGIGTGFVARFDTSQSGSSSLVFATYLGGNVSGDQPHGIALDSTGNAYLTGETWSGNFPVTPGAPQAIGDSGLQNGFMTVLTADGTKVPFSTYFGSNQAAGAGLALDSALPPNVFITGSTTTTKFPTTVGAYQTSLQGFSDAFVAELSPGAAQGVFVNPSSLAFGNQPEGTTSSPQTVTLVNNTSTSLGSIVISIIGTNSSDFGQVNNCPTPASLAAGSSCTITVTFDPSTTSAESATLNIADTDASSPQTVALSGTGTTPPAGVALTPSSANFGTLTVKTSSTAQVFTLSNNSQNALGNIVASVTGTNAADFTIQGNTCPSSPNTLAKGTACTITMIFTPSLTSSESATLSVADTDASTPQTASLSGTGTAPAGSVTVAPASIAFGSVNINSTSSAQTVTLTNGTTTSLTGISVSVTGTNAADFVAGSKCGTSLAASSNCTISVTFSPTAAGAESATLSIADSDASSPQTVALSGTGVAAGPDFTISASPTSASVGTHGSVAATVTVTSVSGFTSPVTLSCGSLPGDASCSFSQNPLTPAANGTASATVTFTTSAGVIAAAPVSSPTRPYPPAKIWIFATLALALVGMWRMTGRGVRRAVCGFALLSLVAMAGCTGSPSTPKGTYTVALTGQSSSASHAFKFTLTVN